MSDYTNSYEYNLERRLNEKIAPEAIRVGDVIYAKPNGKGDNYPARQLCVTEITYYKPATWVREDGEPTLAVWAFSGNRLTKSSFKWYVSSSIYDFILVDEQTMPTAVTFPQKQHAMTCCACCPNKRVDEELF